MGDFFLTEPFYTGVDLQSTCVKYATLRKKKQGWSLVSAQTLSLDNLKQHDFEKKGILISALNMRDVLVRRCMIPLKKRKDIFSTLEFHVEPLIPYPSEGAILQAQILEVREGESALAVFSSKKESVSNHIEAFQRHGLNPEKVTHKAQALASFAMLLPQSNSPLLLVHEGEKEITFVLAEKGRVLAARSIEQLSESEVKRTLLSLNAQTKEKAYSHLFFIGKNPQLHELLKAASGYEVLSPICLSLSKEESIEYALAIGCAIADPEVNFRQKELVYPRPFKHLKKPLAAFVALSLLLSGAVYSLTSLALSQKKEGVEESYRAFVKAEKCTNADSPSTPDEFISSLARIEKEIKSRPDTFALYPQTPKVKEFLSWLTSLPELRGKEGPLIEIETLHYQMVNRPSFNQSNAHYKVRVELELTAKTSQAARLFHETLKSPNLVVDTTQEVQWVSSKGKHKAVFFLKDNTRYSGR